MDRVLEWFIARMVWRASYNPIDGDIMDEASRVLSTNDQLERLRRFTMYVAWQDATLYRIGKSE